MSNNQEIARFKKRLGAIINGPAVRWQRQFKEQPLANLLDEFSIFANKYLDYVADTYSPKESETSLVYDLNTALGSLQQVWAVISRACEQREIQEFKKFLAIADAHTQHYYNHFYGYKVPHAGPITHFEKLYGITRYTFTPYPLISIPLYVFDDPKQWQALAHELGHYIYMNSTRLSTYQEVQTRVRNTVLQALGSFISGTLTDLSISVSFGNYKDFENHPKVAGIFLNWLEEIFADICGTLLVGPAYVISGQRLMEEMASTSDELIADDEVHAAPYLRPLIGLETLNWVAAQLKNSDQKSGANAQLAPIITYLKERWVPLQERGQRRIHKDSGLRMSVIEEAVPVIVRTILEGNKDDDASKSWIGADGEPVNLGDLIDYRPWLNDLPEIQTALYEGRELGLSRALENLVEPQPSPAIRDEDRVKFEELIGHLEKEHPTYKKLRPVLLSLDLEESERAVCKERLVKYVGCKKGSYDRC